MIRLDVLYELVACGSCLEMIMRCPSIQIADSLTLVSLLFDLKLFGQVLVLLPFYLGADRAIVHEVTRVTDLLLIEIGLLKNFILEVVVRTEDKGNLESRFWRVAGQVR